MMKSFSIFVILPLVLTACGTNGEANHSSNLGTEKIQITGSLTQEIETIARGKYLSNCDSLNLPKMREISHAIEQHQTEIDSYAADLLNLQNDSRFHYVKMGPITVRENSGPITPEKNWKFFYYSWSEIEKEYSVVLQNPSAKNWSALNTSVRGILTDDDDRVIGGDAYAIGYLDYPMLKGAHDLTETCLKDESCVSPPYTRDATDWLSQQNDYSELLSNLKAAPTHAASKDSLAKMEKYLNGDMKRFEMRKNPGVSGDTDSIHVPLYAGVFSGVTEQLANYIQSVWRMSNLSVKIDWSSPSNDFFSLLLGPGTGARSYVQYNDRKVVLFDGVNTKSIAHEIGHVLGFKDHYFTVWNAAECQYEEQSNPSDLMSDSYEGVVTTEEWLTLQQTYLLHRF